MIDARHIYPVSDFVKNPQAHIARMKATGRPTVLTVNGRAEVVLLDMETYENLIKQLQHSEVVAALRADMAQARKNLPQGEAMTEAEIEAEIERRRAVVQELVGETERLDLY